MSKKNQAIGLATLLFILFSIPQAGAQYTENLCTGGTPFFNQEHTKTQPHQLAIYAFDGVKTGGVTDGWLSEAGSDLAQFPDWLGYDFGIGNEKIITQYVIYANEAILAPKAWTFEGSNDNTTWDVLDNQASYGGWTEWVAETFQISNSTAYRYYRVHITDSHYNKNSVKIGELEMMGDVPATISLIPDNTSPIVGDNICINVNATNISAMYSASFDLTYDPVKLQYTGATEGNFLNADTGATFFEVSLLNDNPANGVVVVGVSRVADIGTISGSGTLSTVCFSVIGGAGTNVSLGISSGYFEGETSGSAVNVVEEPDPVISIGLP